MNLSKLLLNQRAIAATFTGVIGLLALVAIPAAWAQVAARPTPIAVGEPDPNAPRLPTRPAAEPIPPQVDAIFEAWDADNNGALSSQEFRTGYLGLRRAGELQGRLRHQFATVDANKNNAIDPAEYGSLLLVKNAGKTAPQMSTFDTNKDQRLEFGEYLTLVRRMGARQTTAPVAPARQP